MGQSEAGPTASNIPAQGPVVFHAPPGGWSREAYHDAIQAFTRARGRAPQTVTMHPQTLGLVTRTFVRREVGKVLAEVREVVQREEQVLEQVLEEAEDAVTIVTPEEHDRATIVMT